MFGGPTSPPPVPANTGATPTFASAAGSGATSLAGDKPMFGSTILTSPSGDLSTPNTGRKSLLGQ